MNEVDNYDIIVFTDGSCSKNGQKQASAGIGVYFYNSNIENISEKIGGKQTNNTAELKAIKKAIELLEDLLKQNKKVLIVSDSEYSIRCCTSYGEKNMKTGWTKDIPNKELVKQLFTIILNYKEQIFFKHVFSHTGKEDFFSKGNSIADNLANQAVGGISKDTRKEKIYLKVPYDKKDFAKLHGAKWDFKKKKWFLDNNVSIEDKKIINRFI